MSSFEEQFPGLKFPYDDGNEFTYCQEDILEHCLDKQRVREIIDKVFDVKDIEEEVYNRILKQKLGLED